jgi:hypothetical protein
MFTTKHLNRALSEVSGYHKQSIFSARKNLLTYRLSKMNSQYRGGVLERMVRDYYKSIGKNVVHYGGSSSFDMMVDGRRIEVKSALARPNYSKGKIRYSYNFQHICPNNFHKLIMIFVSPEGIDIRSMDSRTVAKYLGAKKKHKSLRMSKKIFGKRLAA